MNIPSPNIPVFDIALLFDLTTYKLKVDLSPSIINDAAGVTVDLQVVKPNGDKLLASVSSTTLAFEMPLPMFANVVMWGYYKAIATLKVGGVQMGVLEKKFNLCAPENPAANTATGKLQITADCARGVIKLTGLSGYLYKGKEPGAEEKNVTFYYPAEAEKTPLKVTNLPFQIKGYTGLNTARGSCVSTFNFDENVSVKVKYIAVAEKNVRCGYDLEKLYCALQAAYGNSDDYELAAEVSVPLFLVTMGLQMGKDVDQYIVQLEKLLKTDCGCCTGAGEPISATIIGSCGAVNNLRVMLTGSTLTAMFDTASLPPLSTLRIRYRAVGSTDWTESPSVLPTYAINQHVDFVVANALLQYEVGVTAICCGGSEGEEVTAKTTLPGVTCPGISGADVEGYPSPSGDTSGDTTSGGVFSNEFDNTFN